MKTGWSFSSEMRSAVLPEARRELIIISFERMSSFFCSSPWMLAVPAAPILREFERDQPGMETAGWRRDSQIEQAGTSDVGSDELARRLDRREENGEVSRLSCVGEMGLQDMLISATASASAPAPVQLRLTEVSVTISVEISILAAILWSKERNLRFLPLPSRFARNSARNIVEQCATLLHGCRSERAGSRVGTA